MSTPTHTPEMPVYTLADVGCYVDSSRGIYAADEIVNFARAHGAQIEHDVECVKQHAETYNKSEFAGCAWANEYLDEADDYMNDTCSVDGAYWGYNAGDWGLWPIDGE